MTEVSDSEFFEEKSVIITDVHVPPNILTKLNPGIHLGFAAKEKN